MRARLWIVFCVAVVLFLSLLLQPPAATGQGPDSTPTPESLTPMSWSLPELEPITSANTDRLIEVGVLAYGAPAQQGVTWAPDGRSFAVKARDGDIWLYATDSPSAPPLVLGGQGRWFSGDLMFSPDGKRLAWLGEDGTVRLWDTATGRQTTYQVGPVGPAYKMIASPNGTHLASWGNGSDIQLWSIATGEQITALPGHAEGVSDVAFSPDATRLAVSGCDTRDDHERCIEGSVQVWDVASRHQIRSLEIEGGAEDVAFSLDGSWLASIGCGDGLEGATYVKKFLRLWNTVGGDQSRTLSLRPLPATGQVCRGVVRISFSPDGSHVLTQQDFGFAEWANSRVRVWDVASGDLVGDLGDELSFTHAVAFSPDGTLIITAHRSADVLVWDAASASLLRVLRAHASGVLSAAFNPDGSRILSVSYDGTLHLWGVLRQR